ncbi:MAG: T9SS type A sorting domain-containing protein [Flavobacteriia bacterium]|nr:T9SS type A sorting domain-containing protein [Flavobacteriia bacterium]
MKHNFLSLSLILLCSFKLFCQNPAIVLAPNYSISGDEPIPLPTYGVLDDNPLTGYDGQKAQYSQNIQVDNEGNILFFIVDDYIFDRNGKFLDKMRMVSDLELIIDPVNGYGSEVMVLPVVDQITCVTSYCIFSSFFGSEAQGPGDLQGVVATYSVLDIEYTSNDEPTANSKLRTMHVDNLGNEYNFITLRDVAGVENYLQDPNADHAQHARLTANLLDNGNFLVIAENLGILVFFNVDANGTISYVNNYRLENELGMNWGATSDDDKFELESVRLANGNIRIGMVRGSINNRGVFCLDINQNGQLIVNSFNYAGFPIVNPGDVNTMIKGFEFSPNGNKLYTCKTLHNGYTNTLDMFDLTQQLPSPQIINISGVNENDYEYSQIESGMNESILIASNNRISRIQNANNPTFPQDFDNNYITLNNYLPVQEILGNYHYKVRLMQDQLDVFDYSQVVEHEFDKITYTATNSATWMPNATNQINNPITTSTSETVYIQEELRIPAGKTITIKDMTFKFAPGARVVIESGNSYLSTSGGKLILDHSTFTVDDFCNDDLWQGVRIEGYPSLSFTTAQGYFEMKNNSMVEHALIGASSTNGGIIKTTNSTFLNNHTGVSIKSYEYINSSNFFKTTFNWTNNIKKPQLAKYLVHINLNNVNGISIKNCDFLNDITTVLYPNYYENGFGINVLNSRFYVLPDCFDYADPNCPLNKKNIFRNLEYGIRVFNYNYMNFQVDFSDIRNCKIGIYTRYAHNERITRNQINIREHGLDQKYGIVLENSTGYTVEQNYLTYHDAPLISNAEAKTFGVVIRESGEEHNEIYKNIFDNLFVGSQAEGNNGASNGDINDPSKFGFQWKCNKFTSNIYKNDLVVANGKVDFFQGTPYIGTNVEMGKRAARNRFSLVSEGMQQQHDIQLIQSQNQMFYTHLSNPNQKPDSYTLEDNMGVMLYSQGNNLFFNEALHCPTLLVIPGPGGGKSTINNLGGQIQQLMLNWEAGDSETLLDFIRTYHDKGIIKEEILKHSPYVSERLLNAYLDRNPNNNDIKDVLIANSALTNSIKQRVNGMTIPNGIKKQIADAQVGLTPRENISLELSYLKSEHANYLNRYLSELESDTLLIDTFKLELENSQQISHRKKLLEIALKENNTNKINEQSSWLLNRGVSQDYIQLAHWRKAIDQYSSYKEGFEQDSTLSQNIINIATSSIDIESKQMAQNIIDIINENFEIVPYTIEGSNNSGAKLSFNQSKQENVQIVYEDNVAQIYPNPSTGSFVVDLVNEPLGSLEIEILDLSGKMVYSRSFENSNSQSIQLNGIANGMYLVNIKHNENTKETHKLEIRNK